ncbi:ABC transporter substrate-binding protein [Pseudoroseomonas cervicalis]|uniref:ABC transporter substrate-binding protein n=1 Tax=Teichococcus cervicalis TaxID=204525 RepID=UPI002780EAF2|nr:ABC transporter substrate-binding protein [Pseudoroseomonas cervicalis]MDQ1079580.1 trehalose/maltose transport system substrate-binding protein [Pseudoroseomonas cervicalis]
MPQARLPRLAALALLVALLAPAARAAEITISCGALGQELELCRDGAEEWARRSGNSVRIVSVPNSASERLALYQMMLAGGGSSIDVYQIDVTWPGILAPHLIDLRPYSQGAEARHFPAIIENNTVDGRLVAMPIYTDAGVLFYRSDLLEKYGRPVPRSWEEMEETARLIQQRERDAGNTQLWGYVFQGRAYEGLTVNALEWIASSGGGTLVDAEGRIDADTEGARLALARAARWMGSIAPQGALTYTEEEARGLFQSGQAVFMRNWPYAWALAQGADSPVRGRTGIASLPRADAEEPSGVLGGWNLGVSRYSRHPAEAASLVMWLAGPEEQKRRAVQAAYNPTLPALYEDAEIIAANPFFRTLYSSFENAVARPSRPTGSKYNRVSNAIWTRVHAVLSQRMQAGAALTALEQDLRRIARRGW